jgi:hypothetical protein
MSSPGGGNAGSMTWSWTTYSWTRRTSRCTPGARAEPVLAAWGITTEGKAVLVALGEGASESTDVWSDFLGELTARGLTPPLLVISDGAGGLINATETVLARSLRQRCLIHRSRKESTCRRAGVRGGGRGRYQGQEFRSGAVVGWYRGGGVPGLFQEGRVSRMALPIEDRQTSRRSARTSIVHSRRW